MAEVALETGQALIEAALCERLNSARLGSAAEAEGGRRGPSSPWVKSPQSAVEWIEEKQPD